MKVWAKVRENGEYHSHNIAQAAFGFMNMGIEIIKYKTIDEIYQWVSPDDIVLDYIDQCAEIFNKFTTFEPVPNYPEQLHEFVGRKIWIDTINSIASNEKKWTAGNFVKPFKEKAFTGKIISSIADLVGCGNHSENYKVYVSEPINIKAEWRCFIYYDKIIDIRPYGAGIMSGRENSWRYSYDVHTIERMMDKFVTWENRPAACSMDIGVILTKEPERLRTVLIEFNDAYALGCYGLHPVQYAKLISARWSQILNRPDELNFRV